MSPPDGLSKNENAVLNFVAHELKRMMRGLLDISTLEKKNREAIYNESRKVQAFLHDLLITKKREILGEKEWTSLIQKLGLTNIPLKFMYEDEEVQSNGVPPIEVHKVRPVYRIGREGKLVEQVMVTLTQTFRITQGTLAGAKFRGGCTLILNISKDYDVAYIIYKNISSDRRFKFQMDYQSGKTATFIALTGSTYKEAGGFDSINFSQLHFHNH